MTLVVALAFAGLWMRSFDVTEYFAFRISSALQVIRSRGGELGWQDLSQFSHRFPVGWSSDPRRFVYRGPLSDPIHFVEVPYWSIVIPLTLLSAYLLLIKPRPAKLKSRPTHA